jgi:hypothetical protein
MSAARRDLAARGASALPGLASDGWPKRPSTIGHIDSLQTGS